MTPDSIRAFTEYLEKAFNLAILMVESGSVIITVQCHTLESLESLWNDYQSGHLKGAVSRNSAKLGRYKMPVKLRET